MRPLFGWLLAVVILSLGRSAVAARGAEVAVLGVHIDGQADAAAVENASLLVQALDKASGIVPVPPGEVRSRLAGREPLVIEGAFLGPGRQKLEEGRILYDRADLAGAIPVLEEAANALTGGLAGAPDSRDLVDSLVLLGLARLFSGDRDGAEDAFSRVVVLDPARELDPVNYPPKALAFFGEVRTALLSADKAELFVEMAGDAELFVDGKQSLSTSLRLPPGAHYLMVEGAGGERAFQAVLLKAGEKKRLRINLKRAVLAATGDSEADRARQTELLYISLGLHGNTGLLLLGGETPDGRVALQLLEARTGNFSKPVTALAEGDPMGTMLDLVPTLARYVTEQGTLRTDRVSPRTVALDISTNSLLASILLDPEPMVETVEVAKGRTPWYLWAAVGAVAAGGAATVAVVLTNRTEDPAVVTQTTTGVIVVGPIP